MSVYSTQAEDFYHDPEDWVDVYGDHLYRYAVARLQDANAAEEVVQDTFLAALRGSNQFSGDGSQRGWLVGILKRKIVDHVRVRSRSGLQSADDGHDPTELMFDEGGRWKVGAIPSVRPDEEVELRELWQVVKSCLQNLPQGQADVFVLSVMEELQSREICDILEISQSNLWVRLHRARLSLAKCVGTKWLVGSEEVRSGG